MLEAGRPLPAADVGHLTSLFDRWNALTASERASEIRVVLQKFRFGDLSIGLIPMEQAGVLVTPLVEGLVDAWWVGEPVNQTVELLNRWVVPETP